MTKDTQIISDEDIQAYIDNQLDGTRVSEVEKAISNDETVLQRYHQYLKINEGLFELAHQDDKGNLPENLLRAAMGYRRRKNHYGRVASLLLLGGIVGFISGIFTHSTQLQQQQLADVYTHLVQPASFAHTVFAPEVKHPVEVSVEQEAHLVAWLSKRLKSDLKAPHLGAAGYALIGGRLLPSTNRMAAQFMYENKHNNRITLYIRGGIEDNQQSAFKYSTSGALQILYWVDGSKGYVLSGELDKSTLLQLGELVYQQLENTTAAKNIPGNSKVINQL